MGSPPRPRASREPFLALTTRKVREGKEGKEKPFLALTTRKVREGKEKPFLALTTRLRVREGGSYLFKSFYQIFFFAEGKKLVKKKVFLTTR